MAKIKYRDINFGQAKLDRIETINRILGEYDDGQALSARQVYYRLVGDLEIENSIRSYKNLTDLLTDARYAGLVDWDIIEDRNREPTIWSERDSIEDALRSAIASFRLRRWRTQPRYVELWVEKQALAGVLEPLAAEFHVTLLVNKGYSSASAMKEAADRLTRRASYALDAVPELDDAPREIIVLYLGDHDPSGEDMVRDVEARLNEFRRRQRGSLEVRKVALTMEQVTRFNLPPQPLKRRKDGQLSDSRGRAYHREHGNQSWELDAIPPREFTRIVRRALESVTDQDAMELVLSEERVQVAMIEAALAKINTKARPRSPRG